MYDEAVGSGIDSCQIGQLCEDGSELRLECVDAPPERLRSVGTRLAPGQDLADHAGRVTSSGHIAEDQRGRWR